MAVAYAVCTASSWLFFLRLPKAPAGATTSSASINTANRFSPLRIRPSPLRCKRCILPFRNGHVAARQVGHDFIFGPEHARLQVDAGASALGQRGQEQFPGLL